jgi:hypothetical protein
VYEGNGSVTLNHNTFLTEHNQTAAVFLSTDFGPLNTIIVTNNLLLGGGYCIYGGGSTVGSELVSGNRFSTVLYPTCGSFGVKAYMPTNVVWTNNVWDNTGQPVS